MQTTTNYALRKPDGTDPVKISDLNLNFDVIDAKIKAVEGKTETIPSKDGTMQGNLNADMLDGYHAASFALKDGNTQSNLNADKLDGYHAASFALKDGNVQTNLNADLLDGKQAVDLVSAYESFNQDSTDLNSYNSNKTWSARIGNNNGNRATVISDYSTVLNVGVSNNSNFQIAGSYDGSNKLGYRCRHDADGVYGSWKRILNEDDYNNLFQFASNGKSAIANAITGKGGTANNGMSFDQLASAINGISNRVSGSQWREQGGADHITINTDFTAKLVLAKVQRWNGYDQPISFYTMELKSSFWSGGFDPETNNEPRTSDTDIIISSDHVDIFNRNSTAGIYDKCYIEYEIYG